MPSPGTPPERTTRTLLQALLGAILALLLLAAVGWWLAGLTPRWYHPADPQDTAATHLGETAEYRLVEELQRIRPPEEAWRLRIPEDAVNAWLATRLRKWLSGQGVDWPEDLSPPQVRMSPAGIEVALSHNDLGNRIGRFRVRPVITGDQLTFEAPSLRLGRLPLPLPTAWVQPALEESLARAEDLAFLATLLQGEAIDAAMPLVDHRHVRLHTITLEPGACVIHASTALNQR